MPDDVTYHGYRILSDIREVYETRIWMGKAAVVAPPDAFGIERVSPFYTGSCFSTEQAAYDSLIAEAKKWIDDQIRVSSRKRLRKGGKSGFARGSAT